MDGSTISTCQLALVNNMNRICGISLCIEPPSSPRSSMQHQTLPGSKLRLPERSQYGRFDLVLASDVIWPLPQSRSFLWNRLNRAFLQTSSNVRGVARVFLQTAPPWGMSLLWSHFCRLDMAGRFFILPLPLCPCIYYVWDSLVFKAMLAVRHLPFSLSPNSAFSYAFQPSSQQHMDSTNMS